MCFRDQGIPILKTIFPPQHIPGWPLAYVFCLPAIIAWAAVQPSSYFFLLLLMPLLAVPELRGWLAVITLCTCPNQQARDAASTDGDWLHCVTSLLARQRLNGMWCLDTICWNCSVGESEVLELSHSCVQRWEKTHQKLDGWVRVVHLCPLSSHHGA